MKLAIAFSMFALIVLVVAQMFASACSFSMIDKVGIALPVSAIAASFGLGMMYERHRINAILSRKFIRTA